MIRHRPPAAPCAGRGGPAGAGGFKMAEKKDLTVTPPSRKVSWRRIVLLDVVLLSIVFAAHAGWRWHAARALDQQIDQLRAAGEPLLPADFRPKDDYPDGNAAPDLTAAATILDDDSPE